MGNKPSISDFLLGLADHVYFQPPESVKMEYPCIVYERDSVHRTFANDSPYVNTMRYTVTVIDKNPNSELNKRMLEITGCAFDRHYVASNLNHDVYTLYY